MEITNVGFLNRNALKIAGAGTFLAAAGIVGLTVDQTGSGSYQAIQAPVVNPDLVGPLPTAFPPEEGIENTDLFPYAETAKLPIPNRNTGMLMSPAAREWAALGDDIFVANYPSYGKDTFTLECLMGEAVGVQTDEGIWETIAKGSGLDLYSDNPYTRKEVFELIQAGVAANIARGYIKSDQDVVFPGHKLLPFVDCVRTDFLADNTGRVIRISQKSLYSSDAVQPHLWISDPVTGELRAAANDVEALSL